MFDIYLKENQAYSNTHTQFGLYVKAILNYKTLYSKSDLYDMIFTTSLIAN